MGAEAARANDDGTLSARGVDDAVVDANGNRVGSRLIAVDLDGAGDAVIDGQATDGAKTDASTEQDGKQNGTNGDSKKESTSKKKKGLRKIVPW